MTRDDEFDDFLRRRKPIFRRDDDDGLEPPPEIDRLVLRQAREAIEPERPHRVFRAPRWGAPIALAATILVALSVVFHVGMPAKAPVGEVTVQNISREIAPPPPPAAAPGDAQDAAAGPAGAPMHEQVAENGTVFADIAPSTEKVEMARSAPVARAQAPSEVASASPPAPPPPFVADAEASRYAEPVPAAPAAPAAAAAPQRAEMQAANSGARADASGATLAKSAAEPAWRRDSKTWLAEIERLRAAGETAKADAEMAEYNRQQRAFAGAPDR
jgi:hypothetical protein